MTPTTTAHLVLEDGSAYRGEAFGARASSYGEVVFSTSMTGYQEMLTDPSFAGQIVMPTYPLVGNYGINARDIESRRVQVSGFVVRRHDTRPSHSLSDMTLHEYLASQGIPGIAGVDTRAITRRLRSRGVMMGAIAVDEAPKDALRRIAEAPPYVDLDLVAQVSTADPYDWDQPLASLLRQPTPTDATRPPRILVSDYGLKYNILRMLRSRGCEVVAMPATASAQDVLDRRPDGVLLSPGPGNPELLDYAVETATGLLGRVPILGICLGNQVLGPPSGAAPSSSSSAIAVPTTPSATSPRPRLHHVPEPRLRRRRRHAARRRRGQPRQPQRRHRRGPAPPLPTRHEHPVPLRSLPGAPRQRAGLRPLPRDDRWPLVFAELDVLH